MYVVLLLVTLFGLGSCQTLPNVDNMIPSLVQDLDECIELGFLCKIHANMTAVVPECISKTLVCDGKKDCSNAIDELVCPKRCSGQILCRDRLNCADKCDGVRQCAGGEDESGCPVVCPDGELLCNDMVTCARPCDTTTICPGGENIWNCGEDCTGDDVLCRNLMTCAKKCDGNRECATGEDEACHEESKLMTCATKCDGNRECATGEDGACSFQCLCRQKQYICEGDSERCIDRSQFCNEVQDECPNGEDEKEGMCL